MATPQLGEILANLTPPSVPYGVAATVRVVAQTIHRAQPLKEQYGKLKETYSKLEEENRKLVSDTTGLVEIKLRLNNNRGIMVKTRLLMRDNLRMRRTLRRLKLATCATLSSERQAYEVEKTMRMHRMVLGQLDRPLCRGHCQR
ncbi:hypothetical protein ACHAO7_001026 [Fusarium culmorum]